MGRRIAVLSLAAAVGASAVTDRAVLASDYSYVPLQLPQSFVFFDARELSQDGKVAGYVRISNETAPFDIATVWQVDGTRESLAVPIPYNVAYANGFQPTGQTLGFLRKPNASAPNAVVWNQSNFSLLPDFGNGSIAIDANKSFILGEVGDPNHTAYIYRLSLWNADGTNPRMVSGLPDVQSRPSALNESGTYVGTARDYFGPQISRLRGFAGRDGAASIMHYTGFDISRATDVNDLDQIVGTYRTGSGFIERGYIAKAFDDEIHDLGLFPGFTGIQPQAINNDGVIVGAAVNNTFERALIWPGGSFTPIDLNTLVDIPGETLVEAMDINNAGQILARGFNGYYIFTPIPEPAALSIILTVGLLLRQRR